MRAFPPQSAAGVIVRLAGAARQARWAAQHADPAISQHDAGRQ
jgi:hypothetical protein